MRLPLVAGNWKMNGVRHTARALAEDVVAGVSSCGDVEVAVCPPFVHLSEVAAVVRDSRVGLGAQNVCDRDQGAFTGEISGDMLADLGCRYVIVGHSERRHVYGEDDVLVARRFAAAKRHGLLPILCVGETLEEREAGRTEAVVKRQLDAVFGVVGGTAFENAVAAYEPVWAIGTGHTAAPEQAQEAHAFIRRLASEVGGASADTLRILYGGSMKPENAGELMKQPDVDGGLIGGASLKADDFLAICRAADT